VRWLLLAAACLLIAAAPAAADPSPGGAQAPEPVEPAPKAGVVEVHGDVSVVAREDTLLGKVARFRGTARRRDAGKRAVVQRFDDRRDRWVAVARTRVHTDGTFVARWRTDHIGRFRLRALLRPRPARQSRRAQSADATVASAELGVTVYRPSFATWYGPGLFGNRTACGQMLTEDLVGVAHRTLPCGTQVAIFYGGRKLVVPVVDRGPFRAGADWDLTQAAAQSLGMEASDTIGAVALR
jgi:hypothetical protein